MHVARALAARQLCAGTLTIAVLGLHRRLTVRRALQLRVGATALLRQRLAAGPSRAVTSARAPRVRISLCSPAPVCTAPLDRRIATGSHPRHRR